MDPGTTVELVGNGELTEVLKAIAAMAEALGPGGVIAILLASPLLMVVIIGVYGSISVRGMRNSFDRSVETLQTFYETHRKETGQLIESWRSQTGQLQEDHRREISEIVRQYGESVAKTTRFYEDNVLLVQNYNQLANGLQDLVITNVRSMEKVATSVASIERVASSIESLCRTVVAKS